MAKANLQVKIRESDEKVAQLEKHIELLTNDLVVTKGSLRAQEDRMQQIDARMRAYDGTAAGLNGAEAEFFTQAAKLRRVVSGVQKIAEVLGEVAKVLVDDRASSKGIDDAINTINVPSSQDLDMREAQTNITIGVNGDDGFYENGGDNTNSD
jgi:septal ring factor EnvC (AmiA/AmiB activator)